VLNLLSLTPGASDEELVQTFGNTDRPLGWFIASFCCEPFSAAQREFLRRCSEAGYSWGHLEYARHEEDNKRAVELVQKAADLGNLCAMEQLVQEVLFQSKDPKKAREMYFDLVAKGWRSAYVNLAYIFETEKDYLNCIKYSVCCNRFTEMVCHMRKGKEDVWLVSFLFDFLFIFWEAVEANDTNKFGCDFNFLAYELGKGMYWYDYCAGLWKIKSRQSEAPFVAECEEYYVENVDLQQKSLHLFLCFCKSTGLLKDLTQMIARMVWDERETNLILDFEERRKKKKKKQR
jgi:hypothetical protein